MTDLPTAMGVSNSLIEEETPRELYAEYNDVRSLDLSTTDEIKNFLKGGVKKMKRRIIRRDSDNIKLSAIDWDDIEMRKALVKMIECDLKQEFFYMLYVVAPLYHIIYHSQNYAGIYDYVNIVKSLKIVTPIEFSSKDVYDLLNSYRKMRSRGDGADSQLEVDNLLCCYYPERAVYEKLKSLLDNEKESEFCEVLANLEEENIYKHCHYYKNICNVFDRVCSRKDFQPIIRADIHCIMQIVEDCGEYFYDIYEDHVMLLLLDVESIIKPKRLAADFQRFLDVPMIAELYAKAKAIFEPSDSGVDDAVVVATEVVDAEVVDSLPTIPDELNTPEAKEVFDEAIKDGLIEVENGVYKWTKTNAALSQFAARMSLYLELSHIPKKGGDPQISWRLFETLFNIDNLAGAYNSTKKTSKDYSYLDRYFVI
ncbi:MAG: hypothetical protein SNG04_05880 [Rikenellaceae bacterium]